MLLFIFAYLLIILTHTTFSTYSIYIQRLHRYLLKSQATTYGIYFSPSSFYPAPNFNVKF